MLVLRLQRTGRKKLAMYRLVAQDKRQHPTSGRVVANLGFYNPHTKENAFNKEQIEKLLGNGAQPSNRVAILLQNNGIKLPDWVSIKLAPEKPKAADETEQTDSSDATTSEEVPAPETDVKDETNKVAEDASEPESAEPAAEDTSAEEQ